MITRQVVGKHILPAGEVHGLYFETEPCLQEKKRQRMKCIMS